MSILSQGLLKINTRRKGTQNRYQLVINYNGAKYIFKKKIDPQKL